MKPSILWHTSKINMLFILAALTFYFSCNSTEPSIPKEEEIDIVIHNWRIYNAENSSIPDNQIKALAVDSRNNLWVGTFYNGVAKFDGSTWTGYNTHNSGLSNDSIECVAVDGYDNVWIGTSNGLVKYDCHDWTVYDTKNSPLPYEVILSLSVDKNNLLWIGCGHATAGGVLTFDGNIWKSYTTENSLLPCSIINIIYVDERNNKWIGTGVGVGPSGSGGLVRIDNHNNWSVYTKQNSGLLYEGVNAIATDLDGNAWIGYNELFRLDYGYYYGGLQKFDGNIWTDYRPNANGAYNPNAIVSNRVDEIVCDEYGYLWIATQTEWEFPYNLSLFKNGTWKNLSDIAQGFPHPFIRDIKIDRNKTVWLATQLGVISIQYSPK